MTHPVALGAFTITGVLGEGGSGVVYAASHAGRPVALKVLRAELAPTANERERFVLEAQNLARIEHPGVVKVYAAGELDDGRPYVAMQRLEGVTLAQRLRDGPLAQDVALMLFAQLAPAIAAMHDAGLIHRDLKPENVMLVDHGGRCVLLDLGIARERDGAPSTTTQAGLQRGTPAYMAPERFFGARATVASDVYELTVILYLMLCGALPWADVSDVRARVSPRAPSELGVHLPAALAAALARGLAAAPEERPQTVDALAREIRAAASPHADLVTQPTRLRSVTTGGGIQTATTVLQPARRRSSPAPIVLGAALLAGGAAGLLALRGGDDPEPRAHESAAQRATPRQSEAIAPAAPPAVPAAMFPPDGVLPAVPAAMFPPDGVLPAVPAAMFPPDGVLPAVLAAMSPPGGVLPAVPAAMVPPGGVLPAVPAAMSPPGGAPPAVPPARDAPEPKLAAEAERPVSRGARRPGRTEPGAPAAGPLAASPPPAAGGLPWTCYRELRALYCAEDFKATEPPSMRGLQCKAWTRTLAGFEAISDKKTHDEMEASCREGMPTWKAAAEERKQAVKAGKAPWQEPGEGSK